MWTYAHQLLLDRFAAKFPPPKDDTNCRVWTYRLAEQFAYSHPTQRWGTKRADAGRPPSTDVICTQSPFVGYDVLLSQGTPQQSVANNPEPIDLTGQMFIPVVPTNHLGSEPSPVLVPPPAPPPCQFPPRDQGLTFFTQLNDKYQARGYRPSTYYVDREGTSVWYAQYLLYRTQGLDHAQAQAKVFGEIDAIWNP